MFTYNTHRTQLPDLHLLNWRMAIKSFCQWP